jgi:hypothetical protein
LKNTLAVTPQRLVLLMQLKLKILLGYNDKDIKVTYNRSLTEVAKGVIMGHGDEGRLLTTQDKQLLD